jgi:transcriptional regulator with XRE-family HTH domain
MLKENLRNAVKASGLYVKEVSAQSGVPKRTIDKWLELEGMNPRAADLYRVARALKKTVEELLTGRTPEGIPGETLELARKMAGLSPGDLEELEAIIGIKLSRCKGGGGAGDAFPGRRKRA